MLWLALAFCLAALAKARPDGTIACDPAQKPFVHDNTDDSPLLISSPGFNEQQPYTPDLDCEWRIFGGSKEVSLQFTTGSTTEDCIDCSCDAVTVYRLNEQGQEELLYTLCGNIEDAAVISAPDTVIKFRSDSVINGAGFEIFITFVNAACVAQEGSSVYNAPGFITSEGFPNNYGNNLDCRWNFEIPSGMVLEWSFESLATEEGCVPGSAGFMFDWIEFFENNDITQSLGRWASSISSPADNYAGWMFKSRSNVTSMRFTSDSTAVATGFNVSYNFVSP